MSMAFRWRVGWAGLSPCASRTAGSMSPAPCGWLRSVASPSSRRRALCPCRRLANPACRPPSRACSPATPPARVNPHRRPTSARSRPPARFRVPRAFPVLATARVLRALAADPLEGCPCCLAATHSCSCCVPTVRPPRAILRRSPSRRHVPRGTHSRTGGWRATWLLSAPSRPRSIRCHTTRRAGSSWAAGGCWSGEGLAPLVCCTRRRVTARVDCTT